MSTSPRIAVAMIVRNEAGRVGRALASVRDALDTWFVIDTGSADNTLEEIETATAGWPGTLLSRPWVSFGDNRTELVRLAREMQVADWLLTIDADHVVEDAHRAPTMVSRAQNRGIDAFMIPFTDMPIVWTIRLLRSDLAWRYVGATREYLTCDEPFTWEKAADGPRIDDRADGASRANKWRRDAEMLRQELASHPDNARSWFYLGESYRGLKQHELAAIAYTNCAVKTRSGEERYLALMLSGEMLMAKGETEDGLARLLLANQERPQRREAVLMACQVLNQMGRHDEVLALLGGGSLRRPIPKGDLMSIMPRAYGSALAHERAVAKDKRSVHRS